MPCVRRMRKSERMLSVWRRSRASNFCGVRLWFSDQQSRSLPVEWVAWVWVQEELREENLEDIDEVFKEKEGAERGHLRQHVEQPGRSPRIELRPLVRCKQRSAPNIGLHVWLITSRQTDPALDSRQTRVSLISCFARCFLSFADARACAAVLAPLVDVWVKNAVHEAYRRRLVGVRVGKLHCGMQRKGRCALCEDIQRLTKR
jgi:hypothetical protein